MKVIRTRTRKLVALAAASALVATGMAVGAPSALATGTWGIGGNVGGGSTAQLTFGTHIGLDTGAVNKLVITGEWSSIATNVTCTLGANAITWTVPNPPPTAASSSTLSISITVPSDLTAGGYATCSDDISHSATLVYVDPAKTTWTLTFNTPPSDPPGSANPFLSTTTGSLTIPNGAITAVLGLAGDIPSGTYAGQCGVTGPVSASPFTGSYSPSTGAVTVNSGQSFNLDLSNRAPGTLSSTDPGSGCATFGSTQASIDATNTVAHLEVLDGFAAGNPPDLVFN